MANNENKETPCCYICCDDEAGEELLSGICSCRGGSMNCHFSCLVETGKAKLDSVVNDGDNDFLDEDLLYQAWGNCPVCKQSWTSDILGEMSDKFTELVSTEFDEYLELKVAALRFKLMAAEGNDHPMNEIESISSEMVEACHEVLDATYDEMTPIVYDGLRNAYKRLGEIAFNRGYATKAMKYYTKCRKLIEGEDGSVSDLMEIDVLIARTGTVIPGVNAVAAWKFTVKLHEDYYEVIKQTFGECSVEVLYAGDLLATALRKSYQFIRYERQCIKSYQIARQLYGAEHPATECYKEKVDVAKKRHAILLSEKGSRLLEVFEYHAASDNYLLKCAEGRDNTVFPVAASSPDIVFDTGTPVVCCGFVGVNKRLNGKLGELHDFDEVNTHVIHFEGDGVHPIKIKPENFRVVFDLPPESRVEHVWDGFIDIDL